MVFDAGLVALEGQRLHIVLAERGKPFLHPCTYGDFARGLIGAFVDGGSDLGQLLADFFLSGTRRCCAGSVSQCRGLGLPCTGLPKAHLPAVGWCRRLGRYGLLFLALIFPPTFGRIEGQLGRSSLTALIAGLGVGSTGASFFVWPNSLNISDSPLPIDVLDNPMLGLDRVSCPR